MRIGLGNGTFVNSMKVASLFIISLHLELFRIFTNLHCRFHDVPLEFLDTALTCFVCSSPSKFSSFSAASSSYFDWNAIC